MKPWHAKLLLAIDRGTEFVWWLMWVYVASAIGAALFPFLTFGFFTSLVLLIVLWCVACVVALVQPRG